MNHLHTIIMSLGFACFLAGCSLTPPSPPLPEGDYRPVNKPRADIPETTRELNGDAS